MSVSSIVNRLKSEDQDYEWYPTTNEIIEVVLRDIKLAEYPRWRSRQYSTTLDSVLDIGAGNGKVLSAFKAAGFGSLYAIEKSTILCGLLPSDVCIIGMDFHEQTFYSKNVDLIFCNPPYSEYEAWAVKIIRENNAIVVYLVIPERWKDSVPIQDALRFRNAKAKTIGSFDFLSSEDRSARAKVNIVKITGNESKQDAFERFFEEQFAPLCDKFKSGVIEPIERKGAFDKLVPGENYPAMLVAIYMDELEHIRQQYEKIGELDPVLLKELNVSLPMVRDGLKLRLDGLRNDYWQELFSRLEPITDRLTVKSRDQILKRLNAHIQVDFTVSNIHGVLIWVIKNANEYFDAQLLDTYELMIDKANVYLYKSNDKVFEKQGWRYLRSESTASHFALDYRIVMHTCGGMAQEYERYSCHNTHGLSQTAFDFIQDLVTIANNLGYAVRRSPYLMSRAPAWKGGKPYVFNYSKDGVTKVLFEVRAFKNRNMHFRLSQEFALSLNVEYGRLRGWLKTPAEAAEELKDERAVSAFKSNKLLPFSAEENPARLLQ